MKILGEADTKTVEWLEIVKNKLPKELYESIIMMEDNHFTGDKSAPVGFTAKMQTYAIIPELITPDIGCGVTKYVLLDYSDYLFTIDDHTINDTIINIYKRQYEIIKRKTHIWKEYMKKFTTKTYTTFGTLGGGNHFLEIGKYWDTNKREKIFALFVHSGSRNFGGQIYNYYINKRNEYYRNNYEKDKENIFATMDKSLINETLKHLKNNYNNLNFDYWPLPKHLSKEFLWDMKLAMDFAEDNRRIFIDLIAQELNIKGYYDYSTIHNYYNDEDEIVRKGAVKAAIGNNLIPLNIVDGILEYNNKNDKKDRNYSLPYGLGRNYSRKEFLKTANLDQYLEETKHIKSMTINEFTLDESPNAYKNKDIIKSFMFASNSKIYKTIYSFKENPEFLKKVNN